MGKTQIDLNFCLLLDKVDDPQKGLILGVRRKQQLTIEKKKFIHFNIFFTYIMHSNESL